MKQSKNILPLSFYLIYEGTKLSSRSIILGVAISLLGGIIGYLIGIIFSNQSFELRELIEFSLYFLIICCVIFFVVKMVQKKNIVKLFRTDITLENNIFNRKKSCIDKLLCERVLNPKIMHGEFGNFYLSNEAFVFKPFKSNKKNNEIVFSPVSNIRIKLEKEDLNKFISWVLGKPKRKKLKISTNSVSFEFRVPEPEETIKKLEVIKEELLSEGSSENA